MHFVESLDQGWPRALTHGRRPMRRALRLLRILVHRRDAESAEGSFLIS